MWNTKKNGCGVVAGPLLLLLLLLLTAAPRPCTAASDVTPFWDMVPAVAQLKMLAEYLSGDEAGGDRTSQNFLRDGLGVSQLRSLYYAVTGDSERALDGQLRFAKNIEVMLDSAPVFGHLKAVGHLIRGETERGWSVLRQATSTTGSAVGAAVAGPAGWVLGHVATDCLVTLAELAAAGLDGPPRAHGLVDLAVTVGHRKPGEIFDGLAGLVSGGLTGSVKPLRDRNDA